MAPFFLQYRSIQNYYPKCFSEFIRRGVIYYAGKFLPQIIRAARVQNEFAPEKFLNRYEKRFEKREKGSEKRSETRLKHF